MNLPRAIDDFDAKAIYALSLSKVRAKPKLLTESPISPIAALLMRVIARGFVYGTKFGYPSYKRAEIGTVNDGMRIYSLRRNEHA